MFRPFGAQVEAEVMRILLGEARWNLSASLLRTGGVLGADMQAPILERNSPRDPMGFPLKAFNAIRSSPKLLTANTPKTLGRPPN